MRAYPALSCYPVPASLSCHPVPAIGSDTKDKTMKTLLLLGCGLFAIAEVTAPSTASWTQIGAVSALGLSVLLLIGKTIPDTNKRFADSIDKHTAQQVKSDEVLRNLTVQCAARGDK